MTESSEKARRGKCIQKESETRDSQGLREGEMEDVCLMDTGFPVGVMGIAWDSVVVMDALPCECT